MAKVANWYEKKAHPRRQRSSNKCSYPQGCKKNALEGEDLCAQHTDFGGDAVCRLLNLKAS